MIFYVQPYYDGPFGEYLSKSWFEVFLLVSCLGLGFELPERVCILASLLKKLVFLEFVIGHVWVSSAFKFLRISRVFGMAKPPKRLVPERSMKPLKRRRLQKTLTWIDLNPANKPFESICQQSRRGPEGQTPKPKQHGQSNLQSDHIQSPRDDEMRRLIQQVAPLGVLSF